VNQTAKPTTSSSHIYIYIYIYIYTIFFMFVKKSILFVQNFLSLLFLVLEGTNQQYLHFKSNSH